jgi:diacylglycerol kinase family enzyme
MSVRPRRDPTHLLVANPAAQSGRNAARIDRALRHLEALGLRPRLLPAQPHGGTVAAVRGALAREGFRCVIAMGGDGTVRDVAEALLQSEARGGVALASLPAGTANNLGRSFGLDVSEGALERNVEIIARGRETSLDAGRLHTMDEAGTTVARACFIDSVGFGIGARIIARRNRDRPRVEHDRLLRHLLRDQRLYAVATLAELTSPDHGRFGASLIADGKPLFFDEITELLVNGTRVYAGRWILDRTSLHDDGLFETAVFCGKRRWLAKAAVDTIGGAALERVSPGWNPLSTLLRVSRLQIRFHVPGGAAWPAIQVDGEELPPAARAEIEVIPRALRLVVP